MIKEELWKLPHLEIALAFSFYMVLSFASKFITENNINYHPLLPLFFWLIINKLNREMEDG